MSEQPTRADRTRQVVVVSHLVGVLGVLTGVGVIGTEVSESSSGALSADATLLAPAGTAFSIWSLIYALLTAYAIYQLFPSTATDPRHRRTGYLAAASMLLNAAWIFVTQWGLLWLSVVVIVALLLVLGALVARLHDRPAVGAAEALLVDGTFGLYLGWVCVATCANVAAALVGYGVETSQGVGEVVAVAVVVVVVGVAAALARRVGPRLGITAAIAWGLAWIAAGRLGDEPSSQVVGLAAAVAAVAVVGVYVAARGRVAQSSAVSG
ncbi:tryptophan-rich sensory protein [Janibacter melonis]|uniref:tryptophan-rich sensory protein n=1 Tax=Janibacter melonis TaxID=262209 RepID=UPI00174CAD8B|nr:tryptophan-rich sensory protein [Janibacter melonis]